MSRIRRLLKYIWPYMRQYPWPLYGTFIAYGIGWMTATLAVPFVFRQIVDVINTATVPAEVATELFDLIIILALIYLIFNIMFRLGDQAIVRFQSWVQRDITNFLFKELGKHSYSFFVNSFAGSLVQKIKRFVRAFETMHDKIVFNFFYSSIIIAGMMIILTFINSTIALIFLVWIIAYLAMTGYAVKYRVKYDLLEAEEDTKITGLLADTITNVLNIKIFARAQHEHATMGTATEIQHQARFKAWGYSIRLEAIQSAFLGILEVGGMYVAIRLWLDGVITVGTVVLIQTYFGAVFHATWTLGRAISDFSKALSDADEMLDILDMPFEILDPAQPEKLNIKNGAITLNNISFQYGENKDNIFQDFSLTIPAGQKVGLVGHSGAGKSTITKLLLRFADVQKGSITIDGQDITKITQDDLRSKISYVPQEPILFHRSLLENIRYSNPKATKKQVIEAAKKAHAHEFITALPDGYKTLVGERGVKLSGGERQRVAIARAMLKNAPVLILDEATSSLDAISEKYIQEAFTELMKNRTTIVIAHRLSTIQKLDRIVVLEAGAIAEEGTHQELLDKEGIYHNFWTHQTDGFIE